MKKILLINMHSINYKNATSITVESILKPINKGNLMEIYYYPVLEKKYERPIIKSIKLDNKIKPLYSFMTTYYKNEVRENIREKIGQEEIEGRESLLQKIKKMVLAIDDLIPFHERYIEEIYPDIEEFNPDVIYTLGASIFSLELSYLLSKKMNIPIVLHYMDNWRETLYRDSVLYYPMRKKLELYLKRVENQMNIGLTISEAMKDYYEEVYKNKYLPLMNTPETNNLSFHTKREKKVETISIVYAGGLHLGRWKSIKIIDNILDDINKKSSIKTIFNIYTSQENQKTYRSILDSPNIRVHNYVNNNEIIRIYNNADILVHVESLGTEYTNFARYSLSTKIPEYLSTGKATLILVSDTLEAYQSLKKYKGVLVTFSKDMAQQELTKLISNKEYREKIGEEGVKLYNQKFSEKYLEKCLKEIGML